MFKLLKILPVFMLVFVSRALAVVNVAVVAPMEGEFSVLGKELIDGVKIAIDDLNSQGGVNGQKINLVTVDDQCNDILAVSTAQMMAVAKDNKVSLVIGHFCDNEFSKVASIYAKAGIMQIVPMALDKGEVSVNYKGLIKLAGLEQEQGKTFFNYYQSNFANKNVAIVYDALSRKQVEIAAEIQKEFMNAGFSSFLESYNLLNYADMEDLAREIAKKNQIAYVLGSAEQVSDLSREIRDENRNLILFVNRYHIGSVYEEKLGDLVEGTYLMAFSSLKDDPDFTETLVNLRLRGEEPKGIGVYGYAAVELWAKQAKITDSFMYNALGEVLNKYKFMMPWGEVGFVNGNPDKVAGYGVYVLQNGEYTQVY